jgi:hypothetical protein
MDDKAALKGSGMHRRASDGIGGLRRKAKRCLAGALLFSGTCLLAVSSSICMSLPPALGVDCIFFFFYQESCCIECDVLRSLTVFDG